MEHKNKSVVSTEKLTEDEFQTALRPKEFTEFTGQLKLVNNLKIFIKAALQRQETLDHVLLTGPPGLGKTTLSHIISNELNARLHLTSGPVLEKPADLAGILTNLENGDVLFIDEIHRLSNVVEEYLYSAMEDFQFEIMIDSGPSARTITISVPPFTMIGATTRAGLLTAPLRSRFGITGRLDYYPAEDLKNVILRSAGILKIEIVEDGALELGQRSRGTPRIANRLLRRARDFAQVKGDGTITKKIVQMTLDALDVDEYGLDEMDKRILTTMIEKFGGGPVGLNTLAVAVSEEAGTIGEVYEPFLIQQGFLKVTPRGRQATSLAYKFFGYDTKNDEGKTLF